MLYGALYLDRREPMSKAHRQITEMRDQVVESRSEPIMFVFDLLYKTAGQANGERAKRQTAEVEDAIHEAFADVTDSMGVVVIASAATSDDRSRPGRDLVMAAFDDPKHAGELLREYIAQAAE